MFTICPICQNRLDTLSDGVSRDRRICTTQCGHIFHAICINKYWRTLLTHPEPGLENYFPCAVCRKISTTPSVFQVYPSSQDVACTDLKDTLLDARISSLEEQNRGLRATLQVVNRKLENTQATLERMRQKVKEATRNCMECDIPPT